MAAGPKAGTTNARPKAKDDKKDGKEAKKVVYPSDFGSHASMANEELNGKIAAAKQDAALVWLKTQEDAGIDIVSDGEQFLNVKYDPDQFGKESYKFESGDDNPFDYAYCITCHKAQGDQFGNVVVVEQECDKWDHVRWAYTAASRAVNGLIWINKARYIPTYLK